MKIFSINFDLKKIKKITYFSIIYSIILLFIITFFIYIILSNLSSHKITSNSYTFEHLSKYEEYVNQVLEEYSNKKVLALTFDDGPGKYTDKLLDILEKHNAKATFFTLGSCINGYEDIILKSNLYGNEIATHGTSHKIMTKMSNADLYEDITTCISLLENITHESIALIRAPYGITSDKTDKIFQKLGLTSIKWDIDSLDWKLKNTDKIYTRVISQVKDRQIILMHDIYKTSIEAAEKIIEELKNEYTFITVSELLILKMNE